MKRSTKYLLAIPLILILILILTNPSYKTFEENLPIITNLPNIAFHNEKTAIYFTYGRQTNYLIFSIYTLDVNTVDGNNPHYKVIGILGNFYKIEP